MKSLNPRPVAEKALSVPEPGILEARDKNLIIFTGQTESELPLNWQFQEIIDKATGSFCKQRFVWKIPHIYRGRVRFYVSGMMEIKPSQEINNLLFKIRLHIVQLHPDLMRRARYLCYINRYFHSTVLHHDALRCLNCAVNCPAPACCFPGVRGPGEAFCFADRPDCQAAWQFPRLPGLQ